MTASHTCSVTVGFPVPGSVCGEPAVFSWTSSKGETFHECARHAVVVAPRPEAVAPGARVEVRHVGKVKVGTVVKAGPARVQVEVPVGASRGRPAGVKVVTFPRAEVRAI